MDTQYPILQFSGAKIDGKFVGKDITYIKADEDNNF